MYQLVCKECGVQFSHTFSHAKFCSNDCKNKRDRKLYKRHAGTFVGLPSNIVGTIAELTVATELLKKGFSVFKAISPSCYCDLIAIKEEKLFQVEVRTGYKGETGKLYFPSKIRKTANLYAIWERNSHEITYLDKDKNVIEI